MPLAWNPDATTYAIGLEDRRVAVAETREGIFWLCRAPTTAIEILGQAPQVQPEHQHTTVREGRPMKLWGGRERDIVTYHGHTGAVKAIAWSPDGQSLASAGYDTTLQMWDAASSIPRLTCRGHLDPVVSVAWSPDGQSLLSGSFDATARIWDANTGQPLFIHQGQSAISAAAWVPSAPSASQAYTTRFACASEDGTVQVWDREHGVSLTYRGHQGSIEALAWSPDGSLLATGDIFGQLHVYDTATGEAIARLFSPTRGQNQHPGSVLAVAWSPTGQHLREASVKPSLSVQ